MYRQSRLYSARSATHRPFKEWSLHQSIRRHLAKAAQRLTSLSRRTLSYLSLLSHKTIIGSTARSFSGWTILRLMIFILTERRMDGRVVGRFEGNQLKILSRNISQLISVKISPWSHWLIIKSNWKLKIQLNLQSWKTDKKYNHKNSLNLW